jgi:hypothetical protein
LLVSNTVFEMATALTPESTMPLFIRGNTPDATGMRVRCDASLDAMRSGLKLMSNPSVL